MMFVFQSFYIKNVPKQLIVSVMKLLTTAFCSAALLAAANPPFGAPACSGPDLEPAGRVYFFLCHDSARRVPLWVGYTLSPGQLDGAAPRPRRFHADYDLTGPAATDRDYRGSGYSRGHLAPSADFAFSPDAVYSTFLLSNAVPQKQSVNASSWLKVENAIRTLARNADRLYVFTGTLFEGEPVSIGPGRVAVPSHTFKAVLVIAGNRKSMVAFIVPNHDLAKGPVDAFQVTVDEVEKRSGLDFFAELDDIEETRLESHSSRPDCSVCQ
jgi:endonuclease G